MDKVKEREDCNHRNTLKYFEDYNLSVTQLVTPSCRGVASAKTEALAKAEDCSKGLFLDGH